MSELRLFYKQTCPYSKMVLSFIDKHHLEDKIEFVDIKADPKNEAELVEKTDKTQVPCLFIDDSPLFESVEIIKYLSEQFVN